jgi:hypothetical protein
MTHEVIPIERIQREALKSQLLYINANDANPYPHQSRAAQVFKGAFFVAREQRQKGVPT